MSEFTSAEALPPAAELAEVLASTSRVVTAPRERYSSTSTGTFRERARDRRFYRIANYHYLVKFKSDSVLHVCSEIKYARRSRDSKIGAFGNYDGRWYDCTVLDRSTDKKKLQQEISAFKKRQAELLKKKRANRNTDASFVLFRFSSTRDVAVVPSGDIRNREEGGVDCEVACSDGTFRQGIAIAEGVFTDMGERARQLTNFEQLSTPEKQTVRNPLIPFTPKIAVDRLMTPLCRRLILTMDDPECLENANTAQVAGENIGIEQINEKVQEEEHQNSSPCAFPLDDDTDHTDFVSPSDSSSNGSFGPASPLGMLDVDHEIENDAGFSSPSHSLAEEGAPVHSDLPAVFVPSDNMDDNAPGVASVSVPDRPAPNKKKNYKRNSACCPFCKKTFVRLSRHMAGVHRHHPQVSKIMLMSIKHDRDRAWRKLRLFGNYEHNCGVLQRSQGTMLLQRKSVDIDYKPEDYLPCRNCKGFFKRRSMYKHVRECDSGHRKYNRIQDSCRLSLPKRLFAKLISKPGYRILTEHVYPMMSSDDVTHLVRHDEVIVKWGVHYCGTRMQHQLERHLAYVVSQKMRDLARLLMALRKSHGEACCLKDFLVPNRFDNLVDAIATTSGLEDGAYKVPSLPIRLGFTLKSCTRILQGEASRREDTEMVDRFSRFLELLNNEWSTELTNRATRQLRRIRFEKRSTKVIPLAEDVMKFVKFLQEQESVLVDKLQEEFSESAWSELCQILLCSIIVFNRKRVGDVDKIPLSRYMSKNEATPNSAIYESLDKSERITAASYYHFYSRGKKESMVPFMVPKSQIPSFDVMINYRSRAGVGDDNPYLFGKGESSFFSGNQALRRLTFRSDIKNHLLLRSTALRKQIATMSQVMNMKPGDLDILANYMGHTVDVHREFYRLPAEALHLARISRLLLAVSSNNVESIRGKSLDELSPPDPNDTPNYLMVTEEDEDGSNGQQQEENDGEQRQEENNMEQQEDERIEEPAGDTELPRNDNCDTEKDCFFSGDGASDSSSCYSPETEVTSSSSDSISFRSSSKRVSSSTVSSSKRVSSSTPSSSALSSYERVTNQTSTFEKKASQRLICGKLRSYIPWSPEEKDAVLKHLSSCVQESRAPSKAEVDACLRHEPVLNSRSWRNVKDLVRNLGLRRKKV